MKFKLSDRKNPPIKDIRRNLRENPSADVLRIEFQAEHNDIR